MLVWASDFIGKTMKSKTREMAQKDARVQAIRKDHRVGLGTCTSIDECWSESEILEFLDDNNIKSAKAAVDWAYEQEGLFREKGANCSSEEPDCELIRSAKEWSEVMKNRK